MTPNNTDISKVFEQNLGSLKQDEDFDLHITEKALALSQPNFSWRLGKESQTSSPMFRHMAASQSPNALPECRSKRWVPHVILLNLHQ
jgi:hypothetical protein